MISRVGLVILGFMLFMSPLFAEDSTAVVIPAHKIHSLWLQTEGSYSHAYAPVKHPENSLNSRMWKGVFAGSGYWLHDSEELQSGLALSLSVGGYDYRYHHNVSYPDYYFSEASRSVVREEALTLRGDGRIYPWTLPLCLMGGYAGFGYWTQRGSAFNSHTTAGGGTFVNSDWLEITNSTRWAKSYQLALRLGIGYGKVREVSVEYDVSKLEKMLRDANLIKEKLSAQSRKAVADLLYKRGLSVRFNNRPDRTFLQELQNAVQADNSMNKEQFNDLDLYLVTDRFLHNRKLLREQGWFAGFYNYVNAEHSRYYTSASSLYNNLQSHSTSMHYSERYSDDYVCYRLNAFFEYHRPIDRHWQLDGECALLYNFEDYYKEYTPSLLFRATYLPDKPWLLSVVLRQSLLHERYDDAPHYTSQVWDIELGSDIEYFASDQLRFVVNANLIEQGYRWKEKSSDSFREGTRNRSFGIRLGLKYQLSGKQMRNSALPVPFSGWPVLPWE